MTTIKIINVETGEEPLEKSLLYLSYQMDRNQVDELMHNEALKKMR